MVLSNKNYIAALIYSDPPKSSWLLIGVHGPPYLALRRKFWRLIEEIIEGFSGHWLLIGDLNSISSSTDKSGGRFNGGSSKHFKGFIENIEAIDLGFRSPHFTWSNKKVGWANIRERLDQGLCNVERQSLFPKAGIKHLSTPNSDHNPILLDTHLDNNGGSRPFRFEAMWVSDESSAKVVQAAWSSPVEGSQCFKLAKRCQKTKKEFIIWNKTVFGYAKTCIKEIADKLKVVQVLDPS